MSPITTPPVIALLDRTVRLVAALRGDGSEMNHPPSYTYLLALFDRSCGLLVSIRLLLLHDQVHEATILARPLFTDSLALAELAAADTQRREELAVGLVMAGIRQGENLFQALGATGEDVTGDLAALAAERADVERYARYRGLTTTRAWQPDDQAKELARDHGRGRQYLDMRVTDHFVHGSAKANEQRLSIREDGTIIVGDDDASTLQPCADATGMFAAQSALFAVRDACVVFGLTEPPEVESLMRELYELHLPSVPHDLAADHHDLIA
jgi:hypothetical protein